MKTRSMYIIGIVTFAVLGVVLLLSTLSASAAATAAAPVPFVWRDTFSSATLDPHWSWIREVPRNWSLSAKSGYMQITTTYTSTVNNILVQPAPPGEYFIETHVLFTPTQDLQSAGLVVYQDDNHYLTLSRAFCTTSTTRPKCVGSGVYFDYVVNGDVFGANLSAVFTTTNNLYLRIQRLGNVYTGSVNITSSNIIPWIPVGVHTFTITSTNTISPTMIGLRATNQIAGKPAIPADFDFFTLSDRSFRLLMPVIFKSP